MLTSILSNASTFGDDVYGEDEPSNALETYVAELTGLQSAVFVLSGTMANQLALRCLLDRPPYSVICGRRSHVFEWECGMAAMFSQAQLIPIMPKSEHRAYLTLEDIIPNIVPDDGDSHSAPTKVIALENTVGGKIVPVEEIDRITNYARERGIKVHLDGARLWNACYPSTTPPVEPTEAANVAKSLLRAYCASVDSVGLCFSKSIGAPSGSILLSKSSSFIARARHFRIALGGGLRQLGVLTSPARVAIDDVFLSGVHLPRANAMAYRLEKSWKRWGGRIQVGLDQETNFVWLDLDEAGVKDEEFVNMAKEEGIKVGYSGRIATHYRKSFKYFHPIFSFHLPVTSRQFSLVSSQSSSPIFLAYHSRIQLLPIDPGLTSPFETFRNFSGGNRGSRACFSAPSWLRWTPSENRRLVNRASQ